jgi:hypothetical protein
MGRKVVVYVKEFLAERTHVAGFGRDRAEMRGIRRSQYPGLTRDRARKRAFILPMLDCSDPEVLLDRLRALQAVVEVICQQAFDEWERRRPGTGRRVPVQQRRYKAGPLHLSPAPGPLD